MHCPFCSTDETKVIDSRLVAEGAQVRRRRECLSCTERFTTYEAAELVLPRIIKQDGSREPFDEEKLRSGLLRALEKRPVSVKVSKLKSIRSNIAFARRGSERCNPSGGRKGHGVAEGARPCCLRALCFGLQKFSGSGGISRRD